jgi:predicted RNase H-like HicB family nuclease
MSNSGRAMEDCTLHPRYLADICPECRVEKAERECDHLQAQVNALKNGVLDLQCDDRSWNHLKHSFRIRAWIEKEDDGFSVYAPDLPGCASDGDTFEACLVNIAEAAQGLLESYRADGTAPPWKLGGPKPLFMEERYVQVTLEGADRE